MVIAHVATAFNILWEEVRLSLTRHRISASKVRAVGMEPNPRLYSPAWRCVIDRAVNMTTVTRATLDFTVS